MSKCMYMHMYMYMDTCLLFVNLFIHTIKWVCMDNVYMHYILCKIVLQNMYTSFYIYIILCEYTQHIYFIIVGLCLPDKCKNVISLCQHHWPSIEPMLFQENILCWQDYKRSDVALRARMQCPDRRITVRAASWFLQTSLDC